MKLINLAEIPIVKVTLLKLDRNPYKTGDIEYFDKRREKLIHAKFRAAVYRLHKQNCPICGESLHNGEQVDLHHINPQKSGGKYNMENILPLHQICHQQVTFGNKSLDRLKIAVPNKSKFDWDKATLTVRARQIVKEAADNSTHQQYTRIEVNGYTDTSGTPQYNQGLSVRRAQAVASELVRDGVPRNATTAQGFGETHLLVATGPGVREPQNRRVEIVIR